MLRLRQKYQTRSVYAIAAFISGTVLSLLYSFMLNGFSIGTSEGSLLTTFFGLPASLAAWLSWPKSGRTAGRMIAAGFLTVAISFLIVGIFSAGYMFFIKLAETGFQDAALLFMLTLITVPLFGSLITLGIPYLIGVLLAVFFADTPRADS